MNDPFESLAVEKSTASNAVRQSSALSRGWKSANAVTEAASLYVTLDSRMRRTVQFATEFAGGWTEERGALKHTMNYPVLITGPTGTGKELLAGIIAAGRAKFDEVKSDWVNLHPLAINCAGLTDTLFESLLFGHKRGSFTGAVKDHPGLLVAAGEGVAFLDEIGELPLPQQAKLLRALQSKKVLPVGADEEVPIDCRFVFATNRDIKQMSRSGAFREDLYWRIAQLQLFTTALIERDAGEVRFIADHINRIEGWTELEDDEQIPIECYRYGNVRQLQAALMLREKLGLEWDEIKELHA